MNVTEIRLTVNGREYSVPVSEFELSWARRSIELRIAEIRADGLFVDRDDDPYGLPIAVVTISSGDGESHRVSIDPCGFISRVLARAHAH